jgi:hypothetical protein
MSLFRHFFSHSAHYPEKDQARLEQTLDPAVRRWMMHSSYAEQQGQPPWFGINRSCLKYRFLRKNPEWTKCTSVESEIRVYHDVDKG